MYKLKLIIPTLLFAALLLNNCEDPTLISIDTADTIDTIDTTYTPDVSNFTGLIKPSTTQEDMDNTILEYYKYWKRNYVKKSGSTVDGYYVFSGGGTGASEDSLPTIAVSEGQGFGMVITALMGEKDSEAKTIFNGMYKFYKDHPCHVNPLLMAWEIKDDLQGGELSSEQSYELTNPKGYSTGSATDGDIDIAYSLLLAHSLWGSDGEINYLQAADSLINHGIRGLEVGESTKRTTLGSWSSPTSYQTRPSDWMTGEFHAFAEMTGETFWNDVVDTTYAVANQIITNYSKATGLVPDFVVGKTAKPASANFLEFHYDGEYYMNACRVPMRIMLDVAHYEDESAIEWMMRVAHWITKKTNNNPSNIQMGYYIEDGEAIWESNSPIFASPLIVAASIEPKYQSFVNAGWNKMKNWKSGYYDDCINFMCMLLLTDNWWKPSL